ncbi:MAG: hypothetical protein ACTSPY_18355 [Candidatus Helarchaeota archaeon]
MIILSNIAYLEGNPFKEKLKLFVYDVPENISFLKLGNEIKKIRSINHDLIIFHQGHSIYCSYKIPNNNEFELIKNPNIESFSTSNEREREILKLFLGESIATRLRNIKDRIWRADRVSSNNLVYYAAELKYINKFYPAIVHNGFKYYPLVFLDGSSAVIIDPTHKMYSQRTLKDLYRKGLEIPGKFIDICPLDCAFKKDNFSSCDLSGHGKFVKFIRFDENFNVDTFKFHCDINEKQISIREYHLLEEVCPLRKLGRKFDNKIPLGIISYQLFGKLYHIPLERLRETFNFNIINNFKTRRTLMKFIQPPPKDRFELTEQYADYTLKNVYLGNNNRNNFSFIADSKNAPEFFYTEINAIPKVVLHNNFESMFPSRDLTQKKPFDYDIRDFNNIKIQIFIFGIDGEDIKHLNEIVSIILNGNDDVSSLKEYFSLNSVIIPKFKKIINNNIKEELSKLIDERRKSSNICAMLIFKPKSLDITNYFKKKLIENEIPNQRINLEEFLKRENKGGMKGYFRNIYLGIYTKMGGVPWKLINGTLSNNQIYLGYASNFSKKNIKFSITLIDEMGIWKKGLFGIADIDKYNEKLSEYLKKILPNNINSVSKICLHASGSLYKLKELPVLINELDSIKKPYQIIEFVNSPIRLFKLNLNNGTREIKAANPGTMVRISNNEIAVLTFTFFDPKFRTPRPILCRNLTNNNGKFEQEINNSFYLSQSYIGYEKRQIKTPISAYTASDILKKAINININRDMIFSLPWFI